MTRRPATILDIFDRCPEFLELQAIRFQPLGLRTVARFLLRLAIRLDREHPIEAEDLAEAGDAIGEVLREVNPALVAGRFARDSPLREIPRLRGQAEPDPLAEGEAGGYLSGGSDREP